MSTTIVKDRITRSALLSLDHDAGVEMVKAVADVHRGVIGFGGAMHHDIEATLLAEGSVLKDLWGFSLYLNRPWSDAFEFRSHVNVRPEDGSPSIQINDATLRAALVALALQRVDWDH